MMCREAVSIRCEQRTRINEYGVWGKMWNFLILEALAFKRPNITRFMSDTEIPIHKCDLSFFGAHS